MHYFKIDDLSNAYDGDTIRQWVVDDADQDADQAALSRLNWARDKAEEYVLGAVSNRYDPTQWNIDADNDGISDNINGVLVECMVSIAIFYLASRRGDVPQSVRDRYDLADLKLQRIAAGTWVLEGSTGNRTISGNMGESDLGELTMNDGADPLTYSEML